jgi:hypothetical protein
MIATVTFNRNVIYKADYVDSGTQDVRNHSSEQKRIPSPSGGRPGRGDKLDSHPVLSPAPRFALPNPLPEGEGVNGVAVTND